MVFSKARLVGPLPANYIGNYVIEYKVKIRLLGVTLDPNLNRIPHLQEHIKSFANKLNLLKNSRFLHKHVCDPL